MGAAYNNLIATLFGKSLLFWKDTDRKGERPGEGKDQGRGKLVGSMTEVFYTHIWKVTMKYFLLLMINCLLDKHTFLL